MAHLKRQGGFIGRRRWACGSPLWGPLFLW
jgi:hypothetical protein